MFNTPGSTLNKVALSLLVVCLGALSKATWSRDDTLELKEDLVSSYGSSAGMLQAKTYYVRGQIKIGDTGGGHNQYRQYIIGFPTAPGPVYIQGYTLFEGSAAPIERLQTRIVHGVVVGDKDQDAAWLSSHEPEIKPWSALPSSDPWRNRFIRANTSKLYWIEFPSGEGTRFLKETASHKYLSFDIYSKKNWPTLTYKGIPLHYAEAIADSNNDYYRWTWAKPDTATCWFQQNAGTSGTPVPTDLSYLEAVDWTNDYTWGLTFHGWDANCGMTKVDSVTSTLDEDLNDWTWQSEINFANSPWNASTGGTNTDFSKVRRVTLMNAPEFLKNDYDMVFNPETGRIYFLAPTTSVNRNGGPAPNPNLESNQYLEVAWPYRTDDSNKNWGSPLVIGRGDETQSRQVIIKDIAFGTGRAMALDMQRMEGTAANPIKIENCRFRNQGHVGVSLWRCKNVKIDGCSFEDGLRGHLKIDAKRDFTKPYVASSSPPISDVKDLVSDGIIVTNSGFYNGGLMWPYNGTVEMANWNIGTEISHNTFDNLSGIAVRIHGAKNLVSQNTVTDCVQDITDYGAIYCGRSLVQLGNDISGNQITGVKWRGRTSQTKTPNSLEDDVCGVYVDDYMCGTTVGENLFSDCQTAIMSNGGRFNLFYRNWFDSSVDYVLRTNVARGTKGGDDAYDVSGTFRFWDEDDFYKRSIANQLYSELRNLYMAVKAEYPTGEFFENTAWTAVFATGAYQISYHPVGEPDTKDLKHLVQRLNHETVGKPDWKTPDASAATKDNNKNSLRRIQYTGLGDWFKSAGEGTISGVPDRKWLVNYDSSNVTILKNYGNAWVWCTDNFADLNKRPVTQHRVFFRSYRDSQPGTADYMADEVGYYSFEVPNTNGQD